MSAAEIGEARIKPTTNTIPNCTGISAEAALPITVPLKLRATMAKAPDRYSSVENTALRRAEMQPQIFANADKHNLPIAESWRWREALVAVSVARQLSGRACYEMGLRASVFNLERS